MSLNSRPHIARQTSDGRRYRSLKGFILTSMRMSHIYQPAMIATLLQSSKGRASAQQIAKSLLSKDRSQVEYYTAVVKNMVGRVLTRHGVVRRQGRTYSLQDFPKLTGDQIADLRALCKTKLAEYIKRRGKTIWEHRSRALSEISGTLRYEVLRAAKSRCELCGISDDERALQVDHILPRRYGGTDDISNLQALCYSCNAMKGHRDKTDFRAVRESYEHREAGCPFCHFTRRQIISENPLAVLIRDTQSRTKGHLLVIPKRHVVDYFELGSAEIRACDRLLRDARSRLIRKRAKMLGIEARIQSLSGTIDHSRTHCCVRVIPRTR